jgi:Uma2 family endonuclease
MKTLLKWSLEDYHQLVDNGLLNGKKVELLAGDLIEVAPESPIHSYFTRTGVQYLRQKLTDLALVMEAHPVTLDNSEPEPDIAIVRPQPHNYKNNHPSAEDIFWLIEISNKTLSYDLNDKKQIYAQADIKEYWVVDLGHLQLKVLRNLVNQQYTEILTLQSGLIYPQAFPDVAIDVQQLLNP